MLVAAAARELDAVDGRMLCSRQLARAAGSATGARASRRASGTRRCRRSSARRTWAVSYPHRMRYRLVREVFSTRSARAGRVPARRSRPPRNDSSMMKHAPTTTPPSCSTRPLIASTVPPVASTSSWITTREPARDQIGMQLERVLAVLEHVARADRLGRQLARAGAPGRSRRRPRPRSRSRARSRAPRRRARGRRSLPSPTSASSPTVSRSVAGSASSGVTSLKPTPGVGKS